VGTLVQVGQGKIAAEDIRQILAGKRPATGRHDRTGARVGIASGFL